MTDLEDLPIGQLIAGRLPLRSLASLASSSRSLRSQIDASHNHWDVRLAQCFGSPAPSGGGDGAAPLPPAPDRRGKAGMCRAWQNACRLVTHSPLTEEYARAFQAAAPSVARVALGRDADSQPGAAPRLAVSLDASVWFSAPGRRRRFSGQAGGHTAWIDALVEVAPGRYATGARDRTVKLWVPFAGAPERASAAAAPPPVAPLRTLRGHADAITALAVVPGSSGSAGGGDGLSSSSSGGGGSGFEGAQPLLASASFDRTVRLWSVAPLLGGGGGGGSGLQLAVLRGHGDAVRALLPHPTTPSTALLSAGRDRRCKVWDLTRAGACAATVRLTEPCNSLMTLQLPATAGPCVAAVGPGAMSLLDLRCSRPVAAFGAPAARGGRGPILCAGASGACVTVGRGRAAAVWDARVMAGGGSSGGSSGPARPAGDGGKPLFCVHQPRWCPVTSLHLDRQKLVTATAAVQLHVDTSIFVWSSTDGRALRGLSSTSSPVQLQQQADPHAALFMGGDDDAWELLEAMDANQMHFMMEGGGHAHAAPQQHHGASEEEGEEGAGGSGDDDGASSQSTTSAGAGGSHGDGGGSGFWDDLAQDEGPAAAGEEDEAAALARARAAGLVGRLEPGVLALACDGPLLACCSTLGATLVADYARASLGPRWWELGGDSDAAGGPARHLGGSDSDDSGGAPAGPPAGGDERDAEGLGGRFWTSLAI